MGAPLSPEGFASERDGDVAEGKYRLLAKLGQGGTANVFLAVMQGPNGFNKLVVLKSPRPEVASDPEFRQMFADEARLSARLNHANIVQTNEVTRFGGNPVIVMEYLEGQSLANLIARAGDKLPLAMHLRILAEALSGLHHAHECTDFDGAKLNVVHRDMSPHNIFVNFDGQVKILDFGIAKLDRSQHVTETGILKGKLRYMAPEQVVGEKLDRRADLFAMGVQIWEACAGRDMWSGMSERNILDHILNGEIPQLRAVKPEIPEPLGRICEKALAAQPEDRYATAAELQADLEAALEGLGERFATRDIGKLVATLFEEERTAARRAIEDQLSGTAALSWQDGTASSLSTATTGHAIVTDAPIERAASHRRRGWTSAAVIAGGVAAVALFAVLRPHARPDVLASSPVAVETISAGHAAPAPAPARPETVTFSVSVTPAQARVFLDDAALPDNPTTRQVPKDDKAHVVRAEAPGFTTTTTSVTFDKDAVVTLDLARPKASPPRPAAPSTARPRATAADPCATAFFIDPDGIKRFKPQCL